MNAKSVNMAAIAEKVGVSKTTVHYALRGTGRVSSLTSSRILKVAKQLGYRPNCLARSLRLRRTETLAVVLGNLASSFHAHVVEGIDQMAQEQNYAILLGCTYGSPRKEQEMIETLLGKGVDGLIIAPSDPKANLAYYRTLIEEGIRFLFLNREVPGIDVDFVSTDNLQGGALAVKHLIRQGRKKIVCVSTTSTKRRSSWVRDRLAGARMALREAGLDTLSVVGPNQGDVSLEEEFAYKAMMAHLRTTSPSFDGVFAIHDGLAYGTIRALLDSGLRVPEDVAVIGFDDQDPSAFIQPPLTTIRQPIREIGAAAARLLFRKFKEPNADVQRLALEPSLVIRKSCGEVSSS
jgi:LacI family transcriptional regulator